jgi:hypothetical protein
MLSELVFLLAMSNPAAAACTRAGGTPSFVQTDKGEQGLCTLPSGVVCEEWAFFRGECPPKKKIKESDEPAKGKKALRTVASLSWPKSNPPANEFLLCLGLKTPA